MANFQTLKGFFTVIGSSDYPKSWSPNNKFGFDANGAGPIFGYSKSDILDVFVKPIEINRLTSIFSHPNTQDPDIANLVIDEPVTNFVVDQSKPEWGCIFSIIEHVFAHQSNVTVDSLKVAITNTRYLKDTTVISRNVKYPERIDYITFGINFAENEANTDKVQVKIYMFADEFVKNESTNRTAVYFYEDLTGDNIIDDNEWKTQVLDKQLNEIFGKGRFKTYQSLQTWFRDGSTWTKHNFYVYSILTITTAEAKEAVKVFLQNKYSYKYCIDHYPDLFGGNVINIYPVLTKDASNTRYLGVAQYSKVVDTLVKADYNAEDNNFKYSDIIFIGNEDDSSQNPIPMPWVCVDSDKLASSAPIASVYNKYIPRYSAFVGYVADTSADKFQTFHHILFIAGSLSMGIITDKDTRIKDIPVEYEFTVSKGLTGKVTMVTFSVLGVRYNVYAG